ncbi:MAG: type II toxin-antitoxin system HicB family antitoxin [Verrucomicrobiota bacterium]
MRFTIVIHKGMDSDYGVSVPDLPGRCPAGDSGRGHGEQN